MLAVRRVGSRITVVNASHTPSPGRINLPLLVAFVGGSCYGARSAIFEVMLFVPTAILVALAGWFLVRNASRRPSKSVSGTVLVGTLITIFALIGALTQSDAQSSGFAGLFLLTWLSIVACITSLRLEDVTKTFAYSSAIIMLGFMAVDHSNLMASLSVSGSGTDVLDRYSGPFQAHPNLIGHIAGCSMVALFWQARDERFLVKILFWAAMVVSVLVCIGASSRGGLFAGVGACGLVYSYEKSRTLKGVFGLGLMAIVGACAVVLLFPNVLDRLDVLLDLSNKQRGLDSGLSGRTEMWKVVLDQFGTANEPYVWGAGFRSTWLTQLTDAIDNGYLMIAAEIGVIGLGLWLLQVLKAFFAAFAAVGRSASTVNLMVLAIIIFFLSESIVARYFLALGNGPSIFFMMLIVMVPHAFINKRTMKARRIRNALPTI